MYADDNQDEIVYSCVGSSIQNGGSDKYSWNGNFKKYQTVNNFDWINNYTVEQRKEIIMEGTLWPYMESIDIYCCQSNKYKQ